MNSVVHFEIPARDLTRAKKFYKDVFNWSMHEFDDDNVMVSTTESDENGMPKTAAIPHNAEMTIKIYLNPIVSAMNPPAIGPTAGPIRGPRL